MNQHPPDTGSNFMQRLGYYALGIAIGLMILGWFQIRKLQARKAQPPTPAQQVDANGTVNEDPQSVTPATDP